MIMLGLMMLTLAVLIRLPLLRNNAAASTDTATDSSAVANGSLRLTVFMMLAVLFGGWLLTCARELWQGHSDALLILPRLLLLLVVLLPGRVITHVALPLGWPLVSYYLSFLCWPRHAGDLRGAALVMGAVTLLPLPKQSGHAAMALRFLERRLEKLPRLGGAGLVTQALLLSRRGDTAGARALLHTLHTVDSQVCADWVRSLALDYLAADAAAQGQWEEVRSLALRPAAQGAVLKFLAACATRFLPPLPSPAGQPTPAAAIATHQELADLWQRLPSHTRAASQSLLLRAQQVATPKAEATSAAASVQPSPLEPGLSSLQLAQRELMQVLQQPVKSLSVPRLLRLGRDWERALGDAQTESYVQKRALVLGLIEGGKPQLASLRADVVEQLSALLQQSGLPIAPFLGEGKPPCALLAEAAQAGRSTLLEDLEATCTALKRRTEDARELPTAAEWHEWAQLLSQYRNAATLGGPSVRHLAWSSFHSPVCSWAVWLWNKRGPKNKSLRILGNAAFRFLAEEAEALSDESNAALGRKNTACGL